MLPSSLPQPARTPSVIGGRHDGDEAMRRAVLMAPRHASEQQRTEPAKHVGQSGAAAERDDADASSG